MHLDIVFKTFVGVLAAIVMVGSGVGVMVGFSRAVAADNYMESISKVIVESNYNEAVIREWYSTGSIFPPMHCKMRQTGKFSMTERVSLQK